MSAPAPATSPRDLAEPLVGPELRRVEERLLALCGDSDSALCQAARDAISAGGKRGRPVVTLLCAKAFGDPIDTTIDLAVAAEVVHVASLMHDDVLDEATIRRGQPSVRQLWGNRRAVLVGDLLVARAYYTLSHLRDGEYTRVLADTVMAMCNSEALFSVLDVGNTTLADYLNLARGKTAALFAAAAEVGALSAGATTHQYMQMRQYGEHLGIAFQATDDLLDLYGDPGQLGKATGRDIASGQVNLPTVLALLADGTGRLREAFAAARELEDPAEALPEIRVLIEEAGGREGALELAREEVDFAIEALGAAHAPNTEAIAALGAIAEGLLVRVS